MTVNNVIQFKRSNKVNEKPVLNDKPVELGFLDTIKNSKIIEAAVKRSKERNW